MSFGPTAGMPGGITHTVPRPKSLSVRARATVSSLSANRLGTGSPSPSKWTGPADDEKPNAPARRQSVTTVCMATISSALAGRWWAASPMTW